MDVIVVGANCGGSVAAGDLAAAFGRLWGEVRRGRGGGTRGVRAARRRWQGRRDGLACRCAAMAVFLQAAAQHSPPSSLETSGGKKGGGEQSLSLGIKVGAVS